MIIAFTDDGELVLRVTLAGGWCDREGTDVKNDGVRIDACDGTPLVAYLTIPNRLGRLRGTASGHHELDSEPGAARISLAHASSAAHRRIPNRWSLSLADAGDDAVTPPDGADPR